MSCCGSAFLGTQRLHGKPKIYLHARVLDFSHRRLHECCSIKCALPVVTMRSAVSRNKVVSGPSTHQRQRTNSSLTPLLHQPKTLHPAILSSGSGSSRAIFSAFSSFPSVSLFPLALPLSNPQPLMSMSSFLPFPCNDGVLVDTRCPTPHLKLSQQVSILHSSCLVFRGTGRLRCCTLAKLDVYYSLK